MQKEKEEKHEEKLIIRRDGVIKENQLTHIEKVKHLFEQIHT